MKSRIYTLLIAALLVLTSCGSRTEEPKVETSDIRYGAEFFDLGIVCDGFAAGCGGDTDGRIYIAASRLDEAFVPRHFLYGVSRDGEPDMILAADSFLINGAEGDVWIKGLQAGADGSVWLTLSCMTSKFSGDYLWHIDQSGAELGRIKLERQAERVLVDDGQQFYAVSGASVLVLDQRQQLQFTLDAKGGTAPQPVRLSSGQAGFLVKQGDTGAEVRTVDPAAQKWGEAYPLPEECAAVYPGSGEYLFFCTSGQTLCGWNTERKTLVQLASWLDAGIHASALLGFTVDADGQILAAVQENGSAQLAMLIPGADRPEKTVLTLAAVTGNTILKQRVAQFNRTSAACRVVLKQYCTPSGEYATYEEIRQGTARLLTDLTAGKVPDMLCLEGLPGLRLGAAGMLEDLWPYIENDPDLGREAVMDHVLECAQQDGKLYTVFDSFVIKTVVGARAVVGDRTSWTLEDLRAALASMPEGCAIFSPYASKLETLKNIIYADLESYVDWESGACSFDSEDFMEILSFCNEMEAEQGGWADWYTLVPEGREMLQDYGISNFITIQQHEAVFGGAVSYVGYPRRDGACGSSFGVIQPMAMTSACTDKEGAWSFLRQFLLPQELLRDTLGRVWVDNARFPVNRASFEALLEESMKLNSETDGENPFPQGMTVGGGKIFDLTYTPTTQAQYDQIMELYRAIDTLYTEDSALWEIVSEQAQPYFAGDRSVDEAARQIQSRVEIYVNELK